MVPYEEAPMLRISKLTDYATVILACLASQAGARCRPPPGWPSAPLGLPTVSKLLKQLQRAGLVTSTRGMPRRLPARAPADQISAARILDALEGPVALTECAAGHSNCGIETTCRVGHAWQRMNGASAARSTT